jgi:hypothetical protein
MLEIKRSPVKVEKSYHKIGVSQTVILRGERQHNEFNFQIKFVFLGLLKNIEGKISFFLIELSSYI